MGYQNQSSKTNREQYNQYIAIPVFCDDTKMGGLLEIVCFNDTEFDGDFMRKNNNNNIKVNDVLDMSYRKNIIIDSD